MQRHDARARRACRDTRACDARARDALAGGVEDRDHPIGRHAAGAAGCRGSPSGSRARPRRSGARPSRITGTWTLKCNGARSPSPARIRGEIADHGRRRSGARASRLVDVRERRQRRTVRQPVCTTGVPSRLDQHDRAPMRLGVGHARDAAVELREIAAHRASATSPPPRSPRSNARARPRRRCASARVSSIAGARRLAARCWRDQQPQADARGDRAAARARPRPSRKSRRRSGTIATRARCPDAAPIRRSFMPDCDAPATRIQRASANRLAPRARTRRGSARSPLAVHGRKEELLVRLHDAGLEQAVGERGRRAGWSAASALRWSTTGAAVNHGWKTVGSPVTRTAPRRRRRAAAAPSISCAPVAARSA